MSDKVRFQGIIVSLFVSVKHGLQPIRNYEAAAITGQADLEGSLNGMSESDSDAEIKHNLLPLS